MTIRPGNIHGEHHAERPLVLMVAMEISVHAARWLETVRDLPYRFVLVPALGGVPIREFGLCRPVGSLDDIEGLPEGFIGVWTSDLLEGEPDAMPAPLYHRDRTHIVRAAAITRAVETLKPAVVHSFEVQSAGYATLKAVETLDQSPPWIVSGWGSDFLLYRKLQEHQPVLRRMARRMDAYIGECRRDHRVVRELGYVGPLTSPIPATGGIDISRMSPLSDFPPPSMRREILVKGYHGWAGRAQHVLSALHIAAPRLRNFTIRIALAGPDTAEMASLLRDHDRLNVLVDPYDPDHSTSLKRLQTARMTIGIGISDGIGTSSLEAMAFGSFPISSCASCLDEWIRPGKDGLIVDAHDVAAISEAIVLAATDDVLVDTAAPRNRKEIEQRWDAAKNRPLIAALYEDVLKTLDRNCDPSIRNLSPGSQEGHDLNSPPWAIAIDLAEASLVPSRRIDE